MPKVKYTATKGLFQETGSGSPNLFHVIAPSDVGSTTKAGGALPVPTTHAVVNMTTGGSEALTLANGVPGQVLHLFLGTDGGDGTLTPATKTGFATIVFADAGDRATLYYVNDTIGWIILGLSGVSAPPVTTV